MIDKNQLFITPTLFELDNDNRELAVEIEHMNSIEWQQHTTAWSYELLQREVYRSDISLDPALKTLPRAEEREWFLDGARIGVELGKRALGKDYDWELYRQIETQTRNINQNLRLVNNGRTDTFYRMNTSGSVDSNRLVNIKLALRAYSERKLFSDAHSAAVVAAVGFIAGNIIKVQRATALDAHIIALEYGDTGFDEERLIQIYRPRESAD